MSAVDQPDRSGRPSPHVLVLSGDVLPFAGLPTSGAGLRAWGIGQGLRAAGLTVRLLMPRHMLDALRDNGRIDAARHAELRQQTFVSCEAALAEHRPDVVVVQHWWLATLFDPGPTPLVIDLHGPMLLEALYQNHELYEQLLNLKVRAFARADFLTCAGHFQRSYFYPWLRLAGHDVTQPALAVVPVSLSPELPEHQAHGETSFVYGGLYLPWQNPLVALGTLIERLERRQQGHLHFFGGAHPILKLAAAEVETVERQLAQSARVISHGLVSHADLLAAYRQAHVAFDLMARNPERELAFTTRTVEYLWCGLPVVYNDYAELAGLIDDYAAGWTVDPLDRRAITAVVDQILDEPAEVERRGRNAQRLARERLSWEKAVAPLATYCRWPIKRRTRRLPPTALPARHEPGQPPATLLRTIDQLETLLLQARTLDTAWPAPAVERP
jgi:glycosyltransferase involved in cell wall biosynthesis